MKALLLLVLFVSVGSSASALESLTGDKNFWPWLWQDQIKPTAMASTHEGQGFVLGAGAVATVLSHQYDGDLRDQMGRNARLDTSTSRVGSILGSGGPGVVIALSQLVFDRNNGLRSTRALMFTSISHYTLANIIQRERPNGHRLAFPSGHTSSAFATATSLAYSYGPYVGVPAITLATFVGVSRMADDAHWLSDTVAGATLGIFWARASAMADSQKTNTSVMPVLIPGGALLAYSADF